MTLTQIDYSRYRLEGNEGRDGALLRCGWSDGATGYADCHAWPELGDDRLDVQLEKLRSNIFTPITGRAVQIARVDAEARAKKVSLLQGLTIPESHFLVTDENIPQNYARYKIKWKHIHLLDRIPNHAKVRIDCNEKLSFEQADQFLGTLDPERIDFIEDPCPYDQEQWAALFDRHQIRLAADRIGTAALGKQGIDVIVCKPAINDPADYIATKQEIVITSYLGHPISQVAAAYFAAKRTQSHCGLLSHHYYQPNAYSARLSQAGPAFTIPEGFGFGFDDLLAKENWHGLRLGR